MHAAGHCCHFNTSTPTQDRNNDERARTFTTRNHRLKVRFVFELPPDWLSTVAQICYHNQHDTEERPIYFIATGGNPNSLGFRHVRDKNIPRRKKGDFPRAACLIEHDQFKSRKFDHVI